MNSNIQPPIGGESIEVREVSSSELVDFQRKHFSNVFSNRSNPTSVYQISESDLEQINKRNKEFGIEELNLIAFVNGVPAGWHYGKAKSGEEYYMQNSAVLPEFRNKGIYSKILDHTLAWAMQKGFQKVTGLHHGNNTSVLLPKIKKGFVLSGMSLHEKYGALFELSYFFDPIRKKQFGKSQGLEI